MKPKAKRDKYEALWWHRSGWSGLPEEWRGEWQTISKEEYAAIRALGGKVRKNGRVTTRRAKP